MMGRMTLTRISLHTIPSTVGIMDVVITDAAALKSDVSSKSQTGHFSLYGSICLLQFFNRKGTYNDS